MLLVNNKYPKLSITEVSELSTTDWELVMECDASLYSLKVYNECDAVILLGWGIGDADPTDNHDFCPPNETGFIQCYWGPHSSNMGSVYGSAPIKIYAKLLDATSDAVERLIIQAIQL